MKKNLFFCAFLFFFVAVVHGQNEARLLRFPAIYNDQIVFSYAGDLYSVTSQGGIARKLTSHVGYEMFPKFSPDGKTLAFTGQYDGNTEVFVMPSQGGVPNRVTYTSTLSRDDVSDRMGPNNIVMAWTPDGKSITYRSRTKSFNAFRGALFNVSPEGGLSSEVPLVNGGFCSYSPDGKKLAFNRVFREFRTWKYYKGGMADDVWIYDFASKAVTNITNNPSQDIFPMWAGDEIFFLSDRDRTMNLFVYNIVTAKTEKVTNFTEYDIKFPSIGKDQIVFENGGYIYKFDTKSRKYNKVPIQIGDDFQYARNGWKDASKSIRTFGVSPNGERVLFSARGDVYTVPYKSGITRNLTQTPNVHEREAVWSPDGKQVAYLSDKTGEFEIYLMKQDGSEPAVQLTQNAETYIFSLKWSPDSKKILFNDQLFRLQMIDVSSKEVTLVDQNKYDAIYDYNWSPDSRWIVFGRNEKNDREQIYLYHLKTKTMTPVTDTWYSSNSPSFSNDGKYLYFSSGRDFNPTYSQTEWNHAYTNMERIYLVPLAKETPSPLAPENNEVKLEQEKPSAAQDAKKTSDKTAKSVTKDSLYTKIDLEGIQERIVGLPIKPSNYGSIYGIDDKVYYIEQSAQPVVKFFDFKKRLETELAPNATYIISSNYKKMLVKQEEKYSVIDLPSAKIEMKDLVDLSNMKVMVDYHQEWQQIYDESWRQMRDFFYVSNMHGLNWKAIHDKYAPLVPYVNHRDDLTYIIGEMIGELSVGHAYVNSGEKPVVEKIKTGMLGARLSRDASGYFKINEILQGANWSEQLRSPLNDIGVNVKTGDYILAINGKSTQQVTDIYQMLNNTAGKKIEITVNSSPKPEGSHKAIVIPVENEASLYYYRWVQNNIRKVSEATHGEVGYVHIPDMGVAGLNEFAKYFYPQLDKKALIVDDRGNGGGNVSPMIIERLRREVTRTTMQRNAAEGHAVPTEMMLGPKVLLIDNYSASDGDLFPYAFKKHQIGKVIGMRTWGGVVGISGSLPFIDGADMRKPGFASYSSDTSAWIIEGHGVDPDILQDNDPSKEYEGEDAQLNKAIDVIKEELKNYKAVPPVPVAPDKSK
jgi:tricorn protease